MIRAKLSVNVAGPSSSSTLVTEVKVEETDDSEYHASPEATPTSSVTDVIQDEEPEAGAAVESTTDHGQDVSDNIVSRQPVVRCRRLAKRYIANQIAGHAAKPAKIKRSNELTASNGIASPDKLPTKPKMVNDKVDKLETIAIMSRSEKSHQPNVKKAQKKKTSPARQKKKTSPARPLLQRKTSAKTTVKKSLNGVEQDVSQNQDDKNNDDVDDENADDDNDNTEIPMRIFRVPNTCKQKDVNQLSHLPGDQQSTAEDDNEGAKNEPENATSTRPCYGCMECPRNFLQRCHLVIHMRTHTGEKPFACSKCNSKFAQKGALSTHMKAHEGVLEHPCPHCDYQALRKIDMLRHVARVHSNERNFVCEVCGKSFTTDVAIKEHVRYVHDRKSQHMCHLCVFVTHRADNLQRHLRVCHTKIEKHECPICGRLVSQRGALLAHLRTHTGERPHACATCGKAFKSHSQLSIHMLTHTTGTIQCETCKRLFKTRFHLERHLVVHTGAKPYECPHCDYACNVKHNITKHVRSVHKIADFSYGKDVTNAKGNDDDDEGDEEEALANMLNDTAEDENVQEKSSTAKEKGKAAAAHFLSKVSLRKDEGLTVNDLRLQLEAEQLKKTTTTTSVKSLESDKRSSPTAAHMLCKAILKKHRKDLRVDQVQLRDRDPNEDYVLGSPEDHRATDDVDEEENETSAYLVEDLDNIAVNDEVDQAAAYLINSVD